MCSDGRQNLTVVAPWKVKPNLQVKGVHTESCACAAFAKAQDATMGPLLPARGRYRHYYYNADDDIVCSSETGFSSECGDDPLDPLIDMNEDDWVLRYHVVIGIPKVHWGDDMSLVPRYSHQIGNS